MTTLIRLGNSYLLFDRDYQLKETKDLPVIVARKATKVILVSKERLVQEVILDLRDEMELLGLKVKKVKKAHWDHKDCGE